MIYEGIIEAFCKLWVVGAANIISTNKKKFVWLKCLRSNEDFQFGWVSKMKIIRFFIEQIFNNFLDLTFENLTKFKWK